MLTTLRIKNLALVTDLTLELQPGYNIITGETGAGKSILVGALSLVLGERADSSILLNKEKKCVVEAHFKATDIMQVNGFLKLNELDAGEELVVRREIALNGKSRAFI